MPGRQAVPVVAQPLLRRSGYGSCTQRRNSDLLRKIGFADGIEMPAQSFGFTTIDLEGLAFLDSDSTLFILGESVPLIFSTLSLWPMLPVVAQGNVRLTGAPPGCSVPPPRCSIWFARSSPVRLEVGAYAKVRGSWRIAAATGTLAVERFLPRRRRTDLTFIELLEHDNLW